MTDSVTNPARWARLAESGLAGSTVLVTGGAGFIGSTLADVLTEVADVRIIDDLSNGEQAYVPDDATFFEGDVRNSTLLDRAMRGVDVVFHQAGLVSVPASIADPTANHERNTSATLRLLERAKAEDARVVMASSTAIYGHPETIPTPESTIPRPESPYAVSKLSVDRYAHVYNEVYGLPTVALRYFNVYGPRQGGGGYSGVIDAFLSQARDGGPLTVHGDGQQTRDFVHVSDVVQANIRAATTDHVGRSFNVGTGSSISIRELAEHVCQLTDSELDIVHQDSRAGDVEHSRADLTRAGDELAYTPTVAVTDGLRDLVEHRRRRTEM
ncbi:NAD-dependent epimerase/dehydratase family protein [Haloarchaeobius sp. DFWS5]|uniref:NAD-dependent epimerase/dehydratase family protein n=1 Tax=Haloarchaeobius sp. DFWS5 TaxID=3446114 RepID=UPI003EBCBED1